MNAAIQPGRKASTAAVQAAADHAEYLTFMLGGEVFAIGILSIKEIIEYGGVTPVPMMPECIRGVIIDNVLSTDDMDALVAVGAALPPQENQRTAF